MQAWSWMSAFLLSFWVSRGIARLPINLKPVPRLLVVHFLAGTLLFLGIAWLKSYFISFAGHQAMPVIYTQLLWLLLDYFLTGARHFPGSDRG